MAVLSVSHQSTLLSFLHKSRISPYRINVHHHLLYPYYSNQSTAYTMWLLNTENLELENFVGIATPPYAILSHTWGVEEVSFVGGL
jgi:hypothetical protein